MWFQNPKFLHFRFSELTIWSKFHNFLWTDVPQDVKYYTETKNNFPNEQIKNFYYFQIERWDLQLLNDKIIKFPHNKIDGAIIKSIELLDREDFKNYNIIDLRIDGKIIVE